ncbi:hypothetical protein [Candidatus Methanoprimaticola sp. MG2]|uniref:hypothetical protein n=1 Tax=Candidatus Methanoprimaticola sp. MG2 TaxID=3228838 RepID=UPI0039C70A3E
MMSEIYVCDGCSRVDAESSVPARCLLVLHNGERPRGCPCGDVPPHWVRLAEFGACRPEAGA